MALDTWGLELNRWRTQHAAAVCIHDFDADGITSAALWKLCCGGELRVTSSRDLFPTNDLDADQGVVLLDLCPTSDPPWPNSTLVIDHHPVLDHVPEGVLWLSSHDWRPPACTSLLVHWLLLGQDSKLGWMAAIGALSDLGDKAPFALVQAAIQSWGLSVLRQLTALINSPHRAEGDCTQAVEALLQHEDPKAMLLSRGSAVTHLRDCQHKVRRRLGQAKQASPKFYGDLAIVEFSSDCAVQSIVAQIWRTRLPQHCVLVANVRPERGEVLLSARSPFGRDVRAELAHRGLVVKGHPGSAGTVLGMQQWGSFLQRCANPPPSPGVSASGG